MRRSYLLLAAGTALLAALLALVPREAGRAPAVRPPAPAAPVDTLSIEIRNGAVRPSYVSVSRGHQVALRVRNTGPRPVRLSLAGYEDLLPPATIGSRDTWSARFSAERPGEDFAWLIGDEPAGRLAVLGPHLVEGHR